MGNDGSSIANTMSRSSPSGARSRTASASDDETPTSALSLAASSEGESFVSESQKIDVKGKGRALDNNDATIVSSAAGTSTKTASWIPAKSWVHFAAGGVGGMCGAIVTAPFDVVKTRLQSDIYAQRKAATPGTAKAIAGDTAASSTGYLQGTRRLLYHFVETGILLRDIGRNEGLSALFRGLGPTLVGVIPARSINFFAYGNGKQIYARALNGGEESAAIHLIAAATAGVITATATNPIWVVKTRLQLQDSAAKVAKTSTPTAASVGATARSATGSAASFSTSSAVRSTLFTPSYERALNPSISHAHQRMAGSLHCIAHIWRHEGIPGFYRGLSASLLGVTEGTKYTGLSQTFKL